MKTLIAFSICAFSFSLGAQAQAQTSPLIEYQQKVEKLTAYYDAKCRSGEQTDTCRRISEIVPALGRQVALSDPSSLLPALAFGSTSTPYGEIYQATMDEISVLEGQDRSLNSGRIAQLKTQARILRLRIKTQ